jgi:hypothetical protein
MIVCKKCDVEITTSKSTHTANVHQKRTVISTIVGRFSFDRLADEYFYCLCRLYKSKSPSGLSQHVKRCSTSNPYLFPSNRSQDQPVSANLVDLVDLSEIDTVSITNTDVSVSGSARNDFAESIISLGKSDTSTVFQDFEIIVPTATTDRSNLYNISTPLLHCHVARKQIFTNLVAYKNLVFTGKSKSKLWWSCPYCQKKFKFTQSGRVSKPISHHTHICRNR